MINVCVCERERERERQLILTKVGTQILIIHLLLVFL